MSQVITLDPLTLLVKYGLFKCKSDWYWSSSSYVVGPGYAWGVYFSVVVGGHQGFVRAVRSGP